MFDGELADRVLVDADAEAWTGGDLGYALGDADDRVGGVGAGEELAAVEVAYLSGPEASWANGERIRAFSSVEPFGLHITVIPCGSTSRDGYDTAPAVRGTDATAIVTYNDLVALGALTRLRELGIAVPDQISIAGFDDISLDRSAHSIVTTVSVPRDRLGRDAADLLEQLMTTGHDCEPQSLPMQLLVRDTTAPPPADRGA